MDRKTCIPQWRPHLRPMLAPVHEIPPVGCNHCHLGCRTWLGPQEIAESQPRGSKTNSLTLSLPGLRCDLKRTDQRKTKFRMHQHMVMLNQKGWIFCQLPHHQFQKSCGRLSNPRTSRSPTFRVSATDWPETSKISGYFCNQLLQLCCRWSFKISRGWASRADLSFLLH